MDFKSLIAKIESIDGKIETPAAPKLAAPIHLNEEASLRVLSGVTALSEELKKVGDTATTHKGGTVTKTEKGIKHTRRDDYDGSDHSDDAQKKPSKAAKSAAEKKGDRELDKAEKEKSKDWQKRFGKDSVRKVSSESIDPVEFKEKFSKMVEAKKVDEKKDKKSKKMEEGSKPDFLDVDKDGDKKEPMKKASKEADSGEDKKETKGLSAKQKKLPPGLQKAIAKKKGTAESVKTDEALDMNLIKSAQGAMSKNKKDKESDDNVRKPYGYRGADGSESDDDATKAKKKSKKVVAESVEQKLSLKDMLKIVKESGGQQAIDPVDQTLWSWANRVAASKVQESQKAEIFAAMIYERNGGRFEMYDVLAEDQK
jgi:hypothetical protein